MKRSMDKASSRQGHPALFAQQPSSLTGDAAIDFAADGRDGQEALHTAVVHQEVPAGHEPQSAIMDVQLPDGGGEGAPAEDRTIPEQQLNSMSAQLDPCRTVPGEGDNGVLPESGLDARIVSSAPQSPSSRPAVSQPSTPQAGVSPAVSHPSTPRAELSPTTSHRSTPKAPLSPTASQRSTVTGPMSPTASQPTASQVSDNYEEYDDFSAPAPALGTAASHREADAPAEGDAFGDFSDYTSATAFISASSQQAQAPMPSEDSFGDFADYASRSEVSGHSAPVRSSAHPGRTSVHSTVADDDFGDFSSYTASSWRASHAAASSAAAAAGAEDDFGDFTSDFTSTSDFTGPSTQPASAVAVSGPGSTHVDDDFGSFASHRSNAADDDDDEFGNFNVAPQHPASFAASPMPAAASPAHAPAVSVTTQRSITDLSGDEFKQAVAKALQVLLPEGALTSSSAAQLLDAVDLGDAWSQLRLYAQVVPQDSLLYNNGIPFSTSSAAQKPVSKVYEPTIRYPRPLQWKGSESERRLLASLGLTEVAAQAQVLEVAEEEMEAQRGTRRGGSGGGMPLGYGSYRDLLQRSGFSSGNLHEAGNHSTLHAASSMGSLLDLHTTSTPGSTTLSSSGGPTLHIAQDEPYSQQM